MIQGIVQSECKSILNGQHAVGETWLAYSAHLNIVGSPCPPNWLKMATKEGKTCHW